MDAQPDTTPEAATREAALLAAAEVRIDPVRITLPYQLSLVVVAVAMLLLPILYVGLIGALAFGVWYWAVHSPGEIFRGGVGLWRAVGYVAPLVGGVTGILFMIKPIFARPPRPPPPLTLSRAEQPLLHAFVERLCEALGAPAPREIHADMQVNASASFRRGVRSMLGNDLVLTLGLPLVAGLEVRQLAGILAHEFGHFSQAVAMRFSYLIASVNHWFVRVVFERDVWDLKLARWSEETPSGYAQLPLVLAHFCVWLSRRVLWVLMHVGHAMSAYLSRQMEYNADRYFVQIVGSDAFRPTYLRIGWLEGGWHSATAHVNHLLAEGRLAVDLPALTRIHADRVAQHDETRTQFERGIFEERTALFDTHPSATDRIRHAERLRLEPRITLTDSARDLIRGFDALAARATADFYGAQLGDEAANFAMVSTEDAATALDRAELRSHAARRVLFGAQVVDFGIAPRSVLPTSPASVEAGVAALERAREQAQSLKASVSSLTGHYRSVYDRERRIGLALLSDAAGMRFTAADFDLPTTDATALLELQQRAEEERKRARAAMAPLFETIRDRMDAALALAQHPDLRGRLAKEATTLPDYSAIARTLQAIVGQWTLVADLGSSVHYLSMLASSAEAYEEKEEFQRHAQELIAETYRRLGRLYERLGETAFPFDHAEGAVSMARYLVPTEPHKSIEILGEAGQALERLLSVYRRCWGELAALVERLEGAVGLPALDLEVGETA